MLNFLWQSTKGYRFTPWKSPYLRWRMETYWGIPADSITFQGFWSFAWQRKRDLFRFVRWAGRNS
jgi:hypothetical protein